MTTSEEISLAAIDALFHEGDTAADIAEVSRDGAPSSLMIPASPYDEASLAHHWWTRGFSYKARLLRAIDVERTVDRLRRAISELADYASTTPQDSPLLMKGYTSELVPRLTRIGAVNVAERVAELRKLADPP